MNDEAAPRALIQFRLLGQVEAWRDGERVELGGRKQRAALASLLVRAGRVVSLDQIVDDLWPEHPPARAAATVQVFVSNLRRALEPDRAARGAGNGAGHGARAATSWPPSPAASTRSEFVRLAEQGRAALDGDDPEQAAALLRRALELWRARRSPTCRTRRSPGPRPPGWTSCGWAPSRTASTPSSRSGRHSALVAELELQVLRHPMRERLRAQLMLALYRCGRQADALQAYRAGRRVLHDELGLEPGSRLRELEQAVLRHDPDLAWEPPAPVMLPSAAEEPPGDEPGRVLVVDDSGVNRRLLVAALTELGHEVHAAENGRRALELLRDPRRLRRRAARPDHAGDGRLRHARRDQGRSRRSTTSR